MREEKIGRKREVHIHGDEGNTAKERDSEGLDIHVVMSENETETRISRRCKMVR